MLNLNHFSFPDNGHFHHLHQQTSLLTQTIFHEIQNSHIIKIKIAK